MTTGDIRNNLKKLQKQASLVRFPDELDYEGLSKGEAAAHLPILYHTFFDFSPRVVENISKLNYSLAGKKDSAFMNVVLKIMREQNTKCTLNLKVSQFMSKGFAERKIILTTNIIEFVRTSSKFTGSKPHVRSKSGTNITALLGVRNATVHMSEISAIPRTNSRPSTPQRLGSHPAVTAPPMHSTGRSILAAPPQMNIIPRTSNIAASPMDDLHSACRESGNVATSVFRHTASETLADTIVRGAEDNTTCDNLDAASYRLSNEVNVLKNLLKNIRETQEALETKNSKLQSEFETVKTENMKIKKELESLEKQQERVDLVNIVARLDIIESKLAVIESHHAEPPHSPVCGDNLCSHMKNLQLCHDESEANVSQMTDANHEKSLLDVTNESPLVHTRQKGMKLLELVQGTRNLLGLSDVSDFQEPEKVKGNSENEPPEG